MYFEAKAPFSGQKLIDSSDRCYNFYNNFAPNTAVFCKIRIKTLVYNKNAKFFCRKLSKIAEKEIDHIY
jgi:hypothetical protein